MHRMLDLEAVQVLRRYTSSGALSDARAQLALDDLRALDIERYPHLPLVSRIWQLRSNVTAYDAAYLAVHRGCGESPRRAARSRWGERHTSPRVARARPGETHAYRRGRH